MSPGSLLRFPFAPDRISLERQRQRGSDDRHRHLRYHLGAWSAGRMDEHRRAEVWRERRLQLPGKRPDLPVHQTVYRHGMADLYAWWIKKVSGREA